MKLSEFNYELPPELIAHQPLGQRSASRMLRVDAEQRTCIDGQFSQLVDLLQPEDLLVFNNTKVIPARLYGTKETGGKVEVLIERITDEYSALAHVKASKAPKGGILLLEQYLEVSVMGREGELFILAFDRPVLEALEQFGHIPLPPYIERQDEPDDRERYQTIYAEKPGAVAAPTAGLHFDASLLQQIRQKGVQFATVTLHVGAGTFQPVRVDDVSKHIMHAEYAEVSSSVCDAVEQCRQRGGRVVAVGTTSVRSLESAAQTGKLEPFSADTRLFIKPGYSFKVVDAMVTNFHLPGSTLLMLVSAFADKELILNSYQHAIAQKYRFFSYGDAMFITK